MDFFGRSGFGNVRFGNVGFGNLGSSIVGPLPSAAVLPRLVTPPARPATPAAVAPGSGMEAVLLGSIAAGGAVVLVVPERRSSAGAWLGVVSTFPALLRFISHQTIATTKTMTMTQINQSMVEALLLTGVKLVVMPTLRACLWAVQRLTCRFDRNISCLTNCRPG